MIERVTGHYNIEGHVEDIFGGVSGVARLARISQTCLYSGALEGESIAEYTAVLPRNGEPRFQGFQRISGKLGDREGSFVVQVSGDYTRGASRGAWSIVPKSGTDDFVHIRGSGTFTQSNGKPGSYTLEFDLRKPRRSAERNVTDVAPIGDEAPEPAAQLPVIEPGVSPKRSRGRAARARAAIEPAQSQPVISEKPTSRKKPRGKAAPDPTPEDPSGAADPAPLPATPARARRAPAGQPAPLPVRPTKLVRSRRAEAA